MPAVMAANIHSVTGVVLVRHCIVLDHALHSSTTSSFLSDGRESRFEWTACSSLSSRRTCSTSVTCDTRSRRIRSRTTNGRFSRLLLRTTWRQVETRNLMLPWRRLVRHLAITRETHRSTHDTTEIYWYCARYPLWKVWNKFVTENWQILVEKSRSLDRHEWNTTSEF